MFLILLLLLWCNCFWHWYFESKDISGFSEWLEQLKTQSVNPWVSDYRGEVLKLKVDPNSPNKVETNSPISYVRKGLANNHYYIIDVKADIFENALATNLSKNAVAYAISPNGKVISTSGSIEVENDNYLNSIIEQANNIESILLKLRIIMKHC